MNDERVLQALKALAENDGASEAPSHIEGRLRRAFIRRDRAKRAWRRRAIWSGAAAAVVVAAALVVTFVAPARREPSRAPLALPVGDPKSGQAIAAASSPAPVAKKAGVRQVIRAAARNAPADRPTTIPRGAPDEMVTDFFPLLDPAPPFERGEILRVNLPASVMQTVGLPVREERLGERVQADVLVGEEGLPRAIRFVRTDVR